MMTLNLAFTVLLNLNLPQARLFGLDLQTFIQAGVVIVVFVLLSFIVTKLLYNPVRTFLKQRADRVAGELENAENTRLSAIALKEQYEQRLKDIELERSTILDDARKLAMERRNRELAETKKEMDALRARAQVDIIAERDRVKDQVEQAIVEISSEMAGKLLAASIDAETHRRLFDEAMAELEATVFKPASPAVTA